jgi:hypothetical protein
LDEVSLRPTDRELSADRMTLLAQLTLEGLVDTPDMWNRLRADLNRFKAHYRNEYRKYHRDYYDAVTRLRDSMADVPHRLRALSLLNGIEGLGPKAGDDLDQRHQEVETKLAPCSVVEVTAVNVDHAPTCSQCGLRLADTPPETEVTSFLRDLEESLTAKRRQLAGETVSRVLGKGKRADMPTFLKAVRAADLTALVDVMSPDLADFVERLLAQEAILATDADVLTQLAQRYPSMEEEDIEAVADTLKQLLRQAFAEAKKANPDKKTIRLTLR